MAGNLLSSVSNTVGSAVHTVCRPTVGMHFEDPTRFRQAANEGLMHLYLCSNLEWRLRLPDEDDSCTAIYYERSPVSSTSIRENSLGTFREAS